MSDDAFLEVLAGCTEACAGMDLSDDAWKPPDGSYDVTVETVHSGLKESKDTGVNCAWIKPVFCILDGEFKGRTFSDYYWIEPGMTEPSFHAKCLCRYATCLQGTETTNLIEAAEIARASEGEFLNVEVERWILKKGPNKGKTRASIRFCQTLNATDATDATEEDGNES